MSSVQSLREFISERLTAAAEEIFTEFEKTIVRYEEEIDRQRRLLDISWKPHTHLHTTEPPKRQIWKGEEVLADLQLRNHDRNSSLDQEEQQPPVEEPEPPCDVPEAPQMKEEEEELCSSHDEGQFLLKHEAEASMGTPAHVDRDHWEPDPNWDQLLSQNVPVPENRDQGGIWTEDPNTRGHRDDLDCLEPKMPRNTPSGENQFSCDFCGKGFFRNSILMSHMRTHTGERPFTCLTCGKGFKYKYALNTHMISHMGVRPYTCLTCGKGFNNKSILTNHFRIHTGEMPFSCQICGTSFNQKSNLVRHMRIHTGEKPFSCHACGKSFNHKCNLIRHMTTHRGPKV